MNKMEGIVVVTITIEAEINQDKQIVVQLPENIFIGRVKLTIEPVDMSADDEGPITYEIARARLLAAGSLATDLDIPDDLVALTDEELEEMSLSFPPARPIEDYLDEDRGEF